VINQEVVMDRRTVYRASACLALALLGPLACGTDEETLVDPGKGSTAMSRGTTFSVVLQTIGPGEYASPPAISSDAVRFIGVSEDGPSVPAGPTQTFRFVAANAGQAVIVFQNTGFSRTVTDTIVVR
jgi:hypothetical protein